ncbi:hypothetical protein FOCC_FOCC009634 [Frankliniella occidentalis]|nr:hypothetical protein FOCC_FOCC009634 [Frankliniella occidentalis]
MHEASGGGAGRAAGPAGHGATKSTPSSQTRRVDDAGHQPLLTPRCHGRPARARADPSDHPVTVGGRPLVWLVRRDGLCIATSHGFGLQALRGETAGSRVLAGVNPGRQHEGLQGLRRNHPDAVGHRLDPLLCQPHQLHGPLHHCG